MTSRKKTHAIIKLLFVAFAVYAAVTLVSLQMQIQKTGKEISSLSEDIRQQETQNEQMRDAVAQGANDEAVARIAREKLGYVSPGERVFVDTSTK